MGLLNRKKEKEMEATSVKADGADVSFKTDEPVSSVGESLQSKRPLIKRPVVTEKSAQLASTGTYIFEVDRKANKVQIAKEIKSRYGVMPERVNTQIVHGKIVRFGRRMGKRSTWKKALVTLPKGKTIDVYQGV